MNQHNHGPIFGCQHTEVNYCPICHLVYCVTCGKEWFEHSSYTLTYGLQNNPYIAGSNQISVPQFNETAHNTKNSTHAHE